VKLTELVKAGKGWKLAHFSIAPLPDDTIVNREIVNQVALVDAIRKVFEGSKTKNKNVCLSLSGTSLIIKRLQLDVKNARELQDQIFWEAEQYIPFEISEVIMDYQVLSRSKDGRTDAILVAVKKSVLDSYISTVEQAGLKAKIVDVDFFAMQNAYELNYPARPTEAAAVVDLGAQAMKIAIVHNGVPVFTKDTAMGGRALTAEIQKHLNLSFADAEALKTSSTQGNLPQEVSDLMHVASENFGLEIKRAVDIYNAQAAGAPVTHVILGGGSAKIPGLSAVVEEATGLPCQVVNPFNAVSYDAGAWSAEYVQAIAPFAMVPVGLAMRAGAGA